jgi:hypothetical protein
MPEPTAPTASAPDGFTRLPTPPAEHEARRAADWAHLSRPCPNGLACPQCGGELEDAQPAAVLTSHPPRTPVACPACGWAGTRVL